MNDDTKDKQQLFDAEMLPDRNSSEAVMYGSAYGFIKNAQWIWSAITDYLRKKARGLESQIMDREFACNVLRTNRYVIFSPTPPFSSPKQIRDCYTLRDLVRVQNALSKIDHFRQMNEMWARKKALEEYISTLRENGLVTPEDWKTCTAETNMEPITYEFMHGSADELQPGENIDWNEFVGALYGTERKPSPAPEMMEEVTEETTPVDGIQEFVSQYLDEPVPDLLSTMEDRDELIAAALDWLDLSEWDPVEEIAFLIECAEAL